MALGTFNPQVQQALLQAGQSGDAARRQREAMAAQAAAQDQQRQRQQQSQGLGLLGQASRLGGSAGAGSLLPKAGQFWSGAQSASTAGNLGFGAGGGTQLGFSAAPAAGLTAPSGGFWAGAGGAGSTASAIGGLGGLGGSIGAAPAALGGAATSGIGAGGTLGAFAEGAGAAGAGAGAAGVAAAAAPWLLGGLALASLGDKDHNITNLFGLFK